MTLLSGPTRALAREPVHLNGLDGGELRALLGQPAFERHEQPAEYWRYSVDDCLLDLFLYSDANTGRMRVSYYEVRPAGRRISAAYDACDALADRIGSSKRRLGLPPVETH
jgi:hypothetical protein